jgi:hypothetical protein
VYVRDWLSYRYCNDINRTAFALAAAFYYISKINVLNRGHNFDANEDCARSFVYVSVDFAMIGLDKNKDNVFNTKNKVSIIEYGLSLIKE